MKSRKNRPKLRMVCCFILPLMYLKLGEAYADEGLEAYRQGHYVQAGQQLVNQSDKYPLVAYYLGRMRLYGYGQLRNNASAINYFQMAGDKGYLPAQQFLARYALIEEKNPEKALYWFKKAADQNDIAAQKFCAAAYLFGLGVKPNSDIAQRFFIAAAKNGDSIAQYALAENFLNSRQAANKKMGLIWLTKAVAQNNAEAQLKLAELYAKGELVDLDIEKAKELMGLAVAQGNVAAMYQMGELYNQQKAFQQAKDWYTKAANAGYVPAELAMSKLYTQPNTPMTNVQSGYLWMMKAAQHGSVEAQRNVAAMYRNGQGVAANENLAKIWDEKAQVSSETHPIPLEQKASEWLTQGKAKVFSQAGYRLKGILGDWFNRDALKENNYNQSPQMVFITREEIFKPQFEMTNPNEIPISEYYDLIAKTMDKTYQEAVPFPRYVVEKASLSTPVVVTSNTSSIPSITTKTQAIMNPQAPQSVAYLEERAGLGDNTAQFRLGQMYETGIDVKQDIPTAIKYFEQAANQQDLQAEYNLGLIYLEGRGVPADYQKALSLLRDAAFKGNDYAQYTLAVLNQQGYRNASGEMVVQPDADFAQSMFSLAAANDYAPAQYRLADWMVREKPTNISVEAQQKYHATIKDLLTKAAGAGIEQAIVPLAFFNAMDNDKAKQAQTFALVRRAADNGNMKAALLVGLLYDRGIGVPASHSDAMYWYEEANKNPVSAFILGTYTAEGNGAKKDLQKSNELLQQAADAGFSYANLNLAVLQQKNAGDFLPNLEKANTLGNAKAGLLLADYFLSLGNNTEQMQRSRDIYQQLADRGDKTAQVKLGYMYDQGLGVPVDAANAEKWYTTAAEQGQPLGQFLLGYYYQLGRFTNEPNVELAKKWYSRAQDQFVPAAVALGFLNDTNDDNYQQAQASYQKAASKHDSVGLFNLGLLYEKGKGMPVNFLKAKELYQEAAEKGHHQAMVQLAGLYMNGSTGKRDAASALALYKKAAEMGDRDALYQLGLISETGVGIPINMNEAIRYYQGAAEKGNAKAMLALARMYKYGIGVNKDMQQAEKYYKQLSAQNNGYAQFELASLYAATSAGNVFSAQVKKLLQEAQNNGNLEARKTLQLLAAQSEGQLSFIEPLSFKPSTMDANQPADLLYLEALNDWNRGDELSSKRRLDQIMAQFPNYSPAKRTYEQLHQGSILRS